MAITKYKEPFAHQPIHRRSRAQDQTCATGTILPAHLPTKRYDEDLGARVMGSAIGVGRDGIFAKSLLIGQSPGHPWSTMPYKAGARHDRHVGATNHPQMLSPRRLTSPATLASRPTRASASANSRSLCRRQWQAITLTGPHSRGVYHALRHQVLVCLARTDK